MKISALIAELQKIATEHGDVEVVAHGSSTMRGETEYYSTPDFDLMLKGEGDAKLLEILP